MHHACEPYSILGGGIGSATRGREGGKGNSERAGKLRRRAQTCGKLRVRKCGSCHPGGMEPSTPPVRVTGGGGFCFGRNTPPKLRLSGAISIRIQRFAGAGIPRLAEVFVRVHRFCRLELGFLRSLEILSRIGKPRSGLNYIAVVHFGGALGGDSPVVLAKPRDSHVLSSFWAPAYFDR